MRHHFHTFLAALADMDSTTSVATCLLNSISRYEIINNLHVHGYYKFLHVLRLTPLLATTILAVEQAIKAACW